MKLIKIVLVICFFNVVLLSFSEDVSENKDPEDNSADIEAEHSFVPGFIFNSNNILLDLDSYQGGLGAKLLFDNFALRGSLGGSYESADDSLSLNGSFSLELPLFKGPVVPYAGAILNVNYDQEQSADGDDWTRVSSFNGGLGGIIGAEFFIFDYLSVFAEYEISGNISKSTMTESTDGEETKTTANNFQIYTGIGNKASLGIVLYVKPVINKELDEN